MHQFKKNILFHIGLLITTICYSQLKTVPTPPNNWRKSQVYSVKVKEGNNAYKNSYTFEYTKNYGNSDGDWCPVGVDPCSLGGSGLTVANDNHWTNVSYKNRGNKITFEVTKTGTSINSCKVFPKRYGYSATITNGKAYIEVDGNEKYIYLEINGNVKLPMFLFIDPLETETYTADEPGVKYFAPGFHRIGREWKIPQSIHTVYLAPGAILFGSISGTKDGQRIIGRGIISGEKDRFQKKAVGIPWNAVYFGNGLDDILIEGVTSISPIHFHFLTRGKSTTKNCKALSFNYSTDGWGGGTGSLVENCFFKVNDDVVKLYEDNQIARDLVVYHQTNGPVFQFSWGTQNAKNCTVKRIDVVESQTMFSPYFNNVSKPPALIEMRKVLNNNVKHTGHLFEDIQVENGIAGLFVYLKKDDSNGYGVLDLTFKNIHLAEPTWHDSHINGNFTNNGNSSITIGHENVTINGKCMKQSDYVIKNSVTNLTFDNCTQTCIDSDNDGTNDCDDLCKNDPNKVVPGQCGCGMTEQSCIVPDDINDLSISKENCDVQLSWGDVHNETAYRIRRKIAGESTFTNIADVKANVTSYLDETTQENTSYIYMVRPMKDGIAVALSNQLEITIGSCVITSLKTSLADEKLIAIPNPTSGQLTLNKNTFWEVKNISGEVIISGNGQTIDLTKLSNGIYILTSAEGIHIRILKK